MSDEKQWIEVFHTIDKDKNGFLTREEIAQCLKEINVSPDVADKMIKATDVNSDGKISLEEYLNSLRKYCQQEKCSSVQRWKEIFQSMDKDGSGKVSFKELDEYLKASKSDVDKDSLLNWMKQTDKNKDGEIDYDEFLAYVRERNK
ncbi:unnamed protein product [Schistosoma turkestanicum]|nr:unnamed protein product [Schistosoma turkestanicum]